MRVPKWQCYDQNLLLVPQLGKKSGIYTLKDILTLLSYIGSLRECKHLRENFKIPILLEITWFESLFVASQSLLVFFSLSCSPFHSSICHVTRLSSHVDIGNIWGTPEPNNSDTSLMARREIGTRVLGLEVNSKTVDLKSIRMDLEWAVPLLSETNPIEAGSRPTLGKTRGLGPLGIKSWNTIIFHELPTVCQAPWYLFNMLSCLTFMTFL